LDDVLAFADDGLLIISGLDPVTKSRTISELYKREKKDVWIFKKRGMCKYRHWV